MTSLFRGSVSSIPETVIKKIDVAFDTTTLHRSFAKDADYMAAVAELSRLLRA